MSGRGPVGGGKYVFIFSFGLVFSFLLFALLFSFRLSFSFVFSGLLSSLFFSPLLFSLISLKNITVILSWKGESMFKLCVFCFRPYGIVV